MKLKFGNGGTTGAKVRVLTFAARDREKFNAGVKCFPQRDSGWKRNLVFDTGLNALANGIGYGNFTAQCFAGSGTNPNEINFSGSVIFTQVGNTITSSGGAVFTSAMIGGIFKYGATGVSSGAEQYISAIGGGGVTATVSGSGMTIATPSAGAVWQVQQTALQTQLATSGTYVTTTGANSTTFTGSTITTLRTFQFSTPGSTWSVNEIGYGGSSSLVYGRIVLGSTVTVTTAQFLVVQVQLTVTQSPATPSAFGNVGTAFNTTGTAMFQTWSCRGVASNGATANLNPGLHAGSNKGYPIDGILGDLSFCFGAPISQNSTILNSQPLDVPNAYSTGAMSLPFNASQPVGVGITSVLSFSFTTAGETCYNLSFGTGSGTPQSDAYNILLTTPVVLPVGTFSGSATFQYNFTRQLVN